MIGCAPPPPQPITLPNAVASKDSVIVEHAVASKDSVIVEPVVPQEIISVISDTVEITNFDKDTLTIGEALNLLLLKLLRLLQKKLLNQRL